MVVAHIVRWQVEVVACVVQDWQVQYLVFDTFEADHIGGAYGHRHPFHLK